MAESFLLEHGCAYPVLKKHVRMKALANDSIAAIDFRTGSSIRISGCEAVILALCYGEYDVITMVKIVGGAFRFDFSVARTRVVKTLDKCAAYMDLWKSPAQSRLKYDPMGFLQGNEYVCKSFSQSDKQITPTKLILSLTSVCNHQCLYCSNSSGKPAATELSATEWLRLIDEASKLGVVGITLSGGEPSIHKEFPSIIARALAHNIYPIISTNGTLLTESSIRRLADVGLDFVHLSLPSTDERVYDQLVGCKGHMQLALNSLTNLKRAGLFVRVKVVLTRINARAEMIRDLLDVCHNLGADVVHLAPFRLTHRSRAGAEFLATRDQLEEIARVAAEKTNCFGKRTAIQGPSLRNLRWSGPADIVRCGGIKSKCTIMPNGDVTMCETLGSEPDFVIGNVRDKSLWEIWSSKEADRVTEIRYDRIEEPCKVCEHLLDCKTGCFMCSLMYSDNPWSIDPRCWNATIPNNPFRSCV